MSQILQQDPIKVAESQARTKKVINKAVYDHTVKQAKLERKRKPYRPAAQSDNLNVNRRKRRAEVLKTRRDRFNQPLLVQLADQDAWDKAVEGVTTYKPRRIENVQELNRYNQAMKREFLPPKNKTKKKRPAKKKKTDDWWAPLLTVGGRIATEVLPKVLAGMGDYEEMSPGIMAKSPIPESNSIVAAATHGEHSATPVPMIHSRDHSFPLRNTEYLGDLISTTEKFKTIQFPINPGMNETFPWGSQIANNYTNWTALGMVFEIKSEGSDYSNAAGLGYYAIATQYNSTDTNFTDKKEMLNSMFADACKPSLNLMHAIECNPSTVRENDLYIRAGSIPNYTDLRLYDLGKVTIAVGGNTAANAVIGEVWVSYDMLVHIPKMISSTGVNNLFAAYACTGNVTNSAPFGDLQTKKVQSTFDFKFTPTTLTFPPHVRGDFLLEFGHLPSSLINGAVPMTFTLVNCTFNQSYLDGIVRPGYSTTGSEQTVRRTGITVTQDGAQIVFDSGNFASGTTIGNVLIIQVPKPPAESPIFDRLGLNYDYHYNLLMEQFKPSVTNFSKINICERATKNFSMFVKEKNLQRSGSYIICGNSYKKMTILDKCVPLLKAMSESTFDTCCFDLFAVPITTKDYFDELFSIVCMYHNKPPKVGSMAPRHFNNEYFDETYNRVPNRTNAKVRYALHSEKSESESENP